MLLNFRQGIVEAQIPTFIQVTYPHVDLLVTDTNCTIAFAAGQKDYLFTEQQAIAKAWGPLHLGVDQWLYWDLDIRTGNRTFGITKITPINSPTPPASPVIDQHWFNTLTNEMKVWTGVTWTKRIRAFACKLAQGRIPVSMSANAPLFTGTQVGNNTTTYVGHILYDATTSNAIRDASGNFMTTEDNLSTKTISLSQVKVASIIVEGTAQQNMAAHTIVRFTDFGKIVHADQFIANQPIQYGIIEQSVTVGQTINVVTNGMVSSDSFDFTNIGVNALLYCDAAGQLTSEPVIPGQVPVAVVVDRKTIQLGVALASNNETIPEINLATNLVFGISRLSVPAEDETDPVVVGDNDPRWESFVRKTGDSMSGPLFLSGSPISDLHAATKKYVDDSRTPAAGTTSQVQYNENGQFAASDNLELHVVTGDLSTLVIGGASCTDSLITTNASTGNIWMEGKDRQSAQPGNATVRGGTFSAMTAPLAGAGTIRGGTARLVGGMGVGTYGQAGNAEIVGGSGDWINGEVTITGGSSASASGGGVMISGGSASAVSLSDFSGGDVVISGGLSSGSGVAGVVSLSTSGANRLKLSTTGAWSIGPNNSVGTTGQVLSSRGPTTDPVWIDIPPSSTVDVLNDLSDVTVTTPIASQVLTYNGSAWVNADAVVGSIVDVLNDLSDVTVTTPIASQVLTYNGSAWVNAPIPPSSTVDVLNDLSDVTVTTPIASQVLTYNGSAWVNADAPTGGSTHAAGNVYEIQYNNGNHDLGASSKFTYHQPTSSLFVTPPAEGYGPGTGGSYNKAYGAPIVQSAIVANAQYENVESICRYSGQGITNPNHADSIVFHHNVFGVLGGNNTIPYPTYVSNELGYKWAGCGTSVVITGGSSYSPAPTESMTFKAGANSANGAGSWDLRGGDVRVTGGAGLAYYEQAELYPGNPTNTATQTSKSIPGDVYITGGHQERRSSDSADYSSAVLSNGNVYITGGAEYDYTQSRSLADGGDVWIRGGDVGFDTLANSMARSGGDVVITSGVARAANSSSYTDLSGRVKINNHEFAYNGGISFGGSENFGTVGYVLTSQGKYNSPVWAPTQGGSSANALNDLSDVIVTTPIASQVLTYNGSAWVNADAPTGGSNSPIVVYDDGIEIHNAVSNINFVGSGVSVTHTNTNTVDVTINASGGTASIAVSDEDVLLTNTVSNINFVGSGVEVTNNGNDVTVTINASGDVAAGTEVFLRGTPTHDFNNVSATFYDHIPTIICEDTTADSINCVLVTDGYNWSSNSTATSFIAHRSSDAITTVGDVSPTINASGGMYSATRMSPTSILQLYRNSSENINVSILDIVTHNINTTYVGGNGMLISPIETPSPRSRTVRMTDTTFAFIIDGSSNGVLQVGFGTTSPVNVTMVDDAGWVPSEVSAISAGDICRLSDTIAVVGGYYNGNVVMSAFTSNERITTDSFANASPHNYILDIKLTPLTSNTFIVTGRSTIYPPNSGNEAADWGHAVAGVYQFDGAVFTELSPMNVLFSSAIVVQSSVYVEQIDNNRVLIAAVDMGTGDQTPIFSIVSYYPGSGMIMGDIYRLPQVTPTTNWYPTISLTPVSPSLTLVALTSVSQSTITICSLSTPTAGSILPAAPAFVVSSPTTAIDRGQHIWWDDANSTWSAHPTPDFSPDSLTTSNNDQVISWAYNNASRLISAGIYLLVVNYMTYGETSGYGTGQYKLSSHTSFPQWISGVVDYGSAQYPIKLNTATGLLYYGDNQLLPLTPESPILTNGTTSISLNGIMVL